MVNRSFLGHPMSGEVFRFRNKYIGLLAAGTTMMETIKNWLKDLFPASKSAPQDLRNTRPVPVTRLHAPAKAKPAAGPEVLEIDPELDGRIESLGPGKNVLIRNRFIREETGTHDTLKILDDSSIDTGEETGIDPYNTGGFDRSKKWDQRFRK